MDVVAPVVAPGLRRLAFGGIILVAVVVDGAFLLIAGPAATPWSRAVLSASAALAVVVVLGAGFQRLGKIQLDLERQNAELVALHGATVDLHSRQDLAGLLQTIVDRARSLASARRGSLVVREVDGGAESRVESGDLSSAVAAAAAIEVPLRCSGPFEGRLRLEGGRVKGFSTVDHVTLERFAVQAARAIDDIYFNERLRSAAVGEERLRIARDMHEGLAQVLAYVNTKTQAVREFLRAGREVDAVEQLEQLAAAARAVQDDVREGILALRSAGRSDATLGQMLGEYAERWQDESGLRAVASIGPVPRLAPEIELQTLRVAQEALTNVRQHARARQATIRLEHDQRRLLLSVEDDGVGMADAEVREGGPRFGLAMMRERARSIGGLLTIVHRDDGGTRVLLEVPLGEPAPRDGAGSARLEA